MADLHDFRTKLTELGYQVVDAEHRNTGRDRSEIVRDIVHDWALLKLSHAQMVLRMARGCEGVEPNAATHQSPEA